MIAVAVQLQKLFKELISARTAAIKPEHELARLTLMSSSFEEQYRRMSVSITSPSRRFAGIGEINGVPIQGPNGPPSHDQDKMDVDALEHRGESSQTTADLSNTLAEDRPPAYSD